MNFYENSEEPILQSEKFNMSTRNFTDLSQLNEDNIAIKDKYYTMNIVVRLTDFLRTDVKKACSKYLMQKNFDY